MFNHIRARYLIVNGYLSARLLSTDPGVDKVVVGGAGNFLFTPYDKFLVHEMEIFGMFKSYTPVIFRGQRLKKVETLTIGETGSVILDNNAQSNKTWSGISELPFHYVYIHGLLKGGKILNRYENETDDGWNYMYLHNGSSTFEFETEHPFLIETADINGTFTSYKTIAMRPQTNIKGLTISIGWAGHVTFDSDSSHPIGPFASNSSVYADHLITDTGSFFEAGDTHFDIHNVEISGTMTTQPTSDIRIRHFTVTSTGKVNITTSVTLEGTSLDMAGLLDIDFRRWPDNTVGGNTQSNILVSDNITVSGTFQAGSLYVQTNQMIVSGTVDVSGGGYLNDQGLGK